MNLFGPKQAFNIDSVVYTPGGRLGERSQMTLQWVPIHRGHAQVTVDGHEFTVETGSMILLRPAERIQIAFARSTETEHSWVEALPPFDIHASALHDLPRLWQLSEALESFLRLGLEAQLHAQAALRDALARVFFEYILARATAPLSTGAKLPRELEQALAWIRAHLAETVHLADLARAVGISPQHLSRLFRRHLGESPMRALWRLRHARARELLDDTGLRVGEVAGRCGYANLYHFSRDFRQRAGRSPRDWRARRPEPSPAGKGTGEPLAEPAASIGFRSSLTAPSR